MSEILTPQEEHLQPLQSVAQPQLEQEQGVILIELDGLFEGDRL
jgi:hypothetical protein